jgi:SAM-dependent methyltransferase
MNRRKLNTHILFHRVLSGNDFPHEDSSLALIISAQAAHWFDLPYFYNEVRRTLKTNGVLALFGYAFVQIHGRQSDKLNQILTNVNFKFQENLNFYI